MPFQDLPSRREESAPIFDGSDPCEIERYFDDLEFLFLKHRISDDSEKKHAAVRYPGLALEQLWKTAPAFSDPTCTYEEFKAEVIALYPEATAEHEYTRARFEQLVSDRARTEIRSETELGEFYRAFLLTSRILISKGRLGVPEQAHGFLGSFEPRLGTAIRSRLERTFPDHFPEDPYSINAIYDAALYTLAWQRAAPFAQAPHPVPALVPPSIVPHKSHQLSPLAEFVSPLASQAPTIAPSEWDSRQHTSAQQLHAPLAHSSRQFPLPPPPASASHQPIQRPPPPIRTFPPSPEPVSSALPNPGPSVHIFTSQLSAPPTDSPRVVPPVYMPTPIIPKPQQYLPSPSKAFSCAPQSPLRPLVVTAHTSRGCTSQSSAPPLHAPRPVSPPASSSSASPQSCKLPPMPRYKFPPELQAAQSTPCKLGTSSPAPAGQTSAPLTIAPRKVSPPASSAVALAQSLQLPPQSHRSFPQVQQQVLATLFNSAPVQGVPSWKQRAPFIHPPRNNPRHLPSTIPPREPSQRSPPSIPVFPPELGAVQFIPTEIAARQRVLPSQQPAPPAQSPRALSPLSPPSSASYQRTQTLPRPIYAFPLAPQASFTAPPDSAPAMGSRTWKQLASPTDTARPLSPLIQLDLASHQPVKPPPPTPYTFPLALQPRSSPPPDFDSVTYSRISQQPAPSVYLSRHVSPPSPFSLLSRQPVPMPLPPIPAFPTAPQPPQSPSSTSAAFAHTPSYQQHAPFRTAPREIPPHTPSNQLCSKPCELVPRPTAPLPHAWQPISPVQSDQPAATSLPVGKQPACFTSAPCDMKTTSTLRPATPAPCPTMPTAVEVRRYTLLRRKGDTRPPVYVLIPVRTAPTAVTLCEDPQPSSPSQVTPALSPSPPMPDKAFPTALETTQHTAPAQQSNMIDAILDALVKTIAALKSGIEILLGNPRGPESGTEQAEAAQRQAERCRFCSNTAHQDDECKEAVKYILAGKCKRNVFGKLTLPSGAEVPRSIRGRNLRQRFDKYHEQHPGQQAGKGYLATLARARRPVPQDTTCATPLAVAEKSPGTEAVPPALPEVPRQPQCAAAPAQPRGIPPTAGEQSASPRPVAMSFAR
jgi:hypothetical protein